MSMHSPVSFSPQSASSPNNIHQQHQSRPLRIAQPPPLSSSTAAPVQHHPSSTSFPSCSSSSGATGGAASSQLHNSVSVPILHQQQKHPVAVGKQFGRNTASNSALGEQFGRLSYEQLLEMARNQQRQIETNVAELDERQRAAALFGVAKQTAGSESEQQQNATILMQTLRAQIERDEQELAQLGQYQRETRQQREQNERQLLPELRQLETEYAHGEQQLRRAVFKVDSLRSQLEVLYQRRAAAADAAIARQRQINGFGPKISTERRPKASVSPFKSERTIGFDEPDNAKMANKKAPMSPPNGGPSTGNSAAGVVHWRKDQQPSTHHHHQYDQQQHSSGSLLPPAVDKISLRRNSINQAKRNSLITEGEEQNVLAMLLAEQRRGRTHISFGRSWDGQLENCRSGGGPAGGGSIVANAKASLGLLDSLNKTTEKKQKEMEQPKTSPMKLAQESHREKTSSKERSKEQEEEQKRTTITTTNNISQPQQVQEERKQQTQAVQQAMLPAKTSPVKRAVLPTADSFDAFNKIFKQQDLNKKPTEDEVESQKEEKVRQGIKEEEEFDEEITEEEEEESEESKGKSGVNIRVECELIGNSSLEERKEEELHGQNSSEDDQQMAVEEEKPHTSAEQQEEQMDSIEEEEEDKEEEDEDKTLDDIQLDLDNKPYSEVDEEVQLDGSGDTGTPPHTDTESSGPTPPLEDPFLTGALVGVKGILRRKQLGGSPRKDRSKRRVRFELVVLFLDVAYEGDYDTFVQLVSQIADISVANSEGITALHYAICASNEQIVRFLVENGADVNALDVDGWSPLHCAASCDHLPMIRLLVENGACPLATTISKSETVAQIFDERSEFAVVGIQYMDFLEQCMGQVNDGKLYAAYSYEAQREDELNFEEGDELRVLHKGESEEREKEVTDLEEEEHAKHWWLCEHVQSGDRGLVPRNYLALFPSWKHRCRYPPVNFHLPDELNGKEGDGEHSAEEDGSAHSDSPVEEPAVDQMLSVGQNKPLSHQELSTYA